MPEEWEIKLLSPGPLDAAPVEAVAGAAGFEVENLGPRQQTDEYLDTERLDLSRSGGGLRIRRQGDTNWLTWKAAGTSKAGLMRRLEVVQPWRAADVPAAAAELPAEVRCYIEALAYSRALTPLARLETRRHAFRLRHPLSGATAELALDSVRGMAGAGGGAVEFSEVEIEALEGEPLPWEDLARHLVARFGLTRARESKLQRVLRLSGKDVPSRRVSPPLEPSMPFVEAAKEIFRRHFHKIQQEEPGTRLGREIEALHDMRVESRRLRAAFRLLGGAFPPGRLDRFNNLMVRTGRVLGHARDLDVFIESLDSLTGAMPEALVRDMEPFHRLLLEYRSREQRRLVAWLTSLSRLRAYERFETFLERPLRRQPKLTLEVGQVAPSLILTTARRVYRRGSKIGKKAPPEKLHRLRIAMKKMRYAMEDFSDLHGKRLRGFVRSCKELQDTLGAFNDADVGMNWLAGFVEQRGRRLPRRTLLAVGSLMGVLSARREEARGHFHSAWRHFDRDAVRKELNNALLGRL